MTKIKNTVAYPLDQNISENDYVIGSDAETLGKITKNYRMGDLANFISSLSGNFGLNYVFSIYADENSMIPPAGYFFSENNSTTMTEPNEISFLRFNKINANGIDCSRFFEFLNMYDSFDIKLKSVSDPNKFFFFQYENVEIFDDYFRVPVILFACPNQSSLVNEITHAIEPVLKGGGGGGITKIESFDVDVPYVDTNIFSVPATLKITTVFINKVPIDKDQYSKSGDTLTILDTYPIFEEDIIKITGITAS